MRARGFVLAALAAVTACGGAPAPLPPAEETAIRWQVRGQEAFGRGDLAEALAAYEQARRASASVEHVEGVAQAQLNIATVRLRLGEHEAAVRALDEVFAPGAAPARWRTEAAYRRAVIEAGRGGPAAEWIERGIALCRDANCETLGRLHNLKSRLLLAANELAAAEAEARRALDANRGHADRLEQANSLRLLADVAFARREYAPAQVFYEQALALDKAAAEPRKIARDLIGIARALAAQGKEASAAEYAARARRVAESIDDRRGAEEAAGLLSPSGR
jgi:tetratricopeptide (TPR) repeat protein